MKLDMRIEGQKPRLRHRRNLGRIFQVKEDETTSLAMFIGEIGRLGFQVGENGVDSFRQAAIADGSIASLDRD